MGVANSIEILEALTYAASIASHRNNGNDDDARTLQQQEDALVGVLRAAAKHGTLSSEYAAALTELEGLHPTNLIKVGIDLAKTHRLNMDTDKEFDFHIFGAFRTAFWSLRTGQYASTHAVLQNVMSTAAHHLLTTPGLDKAHPHLTETVNNLLSAFDSQLASAVADAIKTQQYEQLRKIFEIAFRKNPEAAAVMDKTHPDVLSQLFKLARALVPDDADNPHAYAATVDALETAVREMNADDNLAALLQDNDEWHELKDRAADALWRKATDLQQEPAERNALVTAAVGLSQHRVRTAALKEFESSFNKKEALQPLLGAVEALSKGLHAFVQKLGEDGVPGKPVEESTIEGLLQLIQERPRRLLSMKDAQRVIGAFGAELDAVTDTVTLASRPITPLLNDLMPSTKFIRVVDHAANLVVQ